MTAEKTTIIGNAVALIERAYFTSNLEISVTMKDSSCLAKVYVKPSLLANLSSLNMTVVKITVTELTSKAIRLTMVLSVGSMASIFGDLAIVLLVEPVRNLVVSVVTMIFHMLGFSNYKSKDVSIFVLISATIDG